MRWDNVTHLFLPRLVENGQFLVGVSPNSTVVPPDTWRDIVYLESGYLQLLWVGGVPLLVGFIALSWTVLSLTRRLEFADRQCRCMRIRPQHRLVDGLGLVADGSAPVHARAERPALHAHCHRHGSSG